MMPQPGATEDDHQPHERLPLTNKKSPQSIPATDVVGSNDEVSAILPWWWYLRSFFLGIAIVTIIVTVFTLWGVPPTTTWWMPSHNDTISSDGGGGSSSSSRSSSLDPAIVLKLLQLNATLKGTVLLRPSSRKNVAASSANTNNTDFDSNNTDFDSVAHVWNQVTNQPWAVVEVADADDVAHALPVLIELSTTVNEKNNNSIPFRIRSGGHHYAGWSGIEDGIILSLSNLNEIEGLDEKLSSNPPKQKAAATAAAAENEDLEENESVVALWIGPVVRVQDILQKVHQRYGYSSVIGMCRTVALGGYALGGGQGLWARKYGLGSDQIVGARLVLANGTQITTNATHRPDILWALQGAGQTNFGVVTQLHYRFYPSYDRHLFWTATIPHSDMPRFFYEVARLEAQNLIPHAVGAFLSSNRETLDSYSATFWYTCFQEADIAIGEDYFQSQITPLLLRVSSSSSSSSASSSLLPRRNNDTDQDTVMIDSMSSFSPASVNVSVVSWYDLSMNRVPLREGNLVRIWNGFLYASQNTLAAGQEIFDLLRAGREMTEYASVGIELWGGAIRNRHDHHHHQQHPPRTAKKTAFFWRDGIYNVHLWLTVPTNISNSHERFESDRKALDPIWETLAQRHLTGTYLNYAEASLKEQDYPRVTYGENLDRLIELKRELDPNNVFSNPQSIPLFHE